MSLPLQMIAIYLDPENPTNVVELYTYTHAFSQIICAILTWISLAHAVNSTLLMQIQLVFTAILDQMEAFAFQS